MSRSAVIKPTAVRFHKTIPHPHYRTALTRNHTNISETDPRRLPWSPFLCDRFIFISKSTTKQSSLMFQILPVRHDSGSYHGPDRWRFWVIIILLALSLKLIFLLIDFCALWEELASWRVGGNGHPSLTGAGRSGTRAWCFEWARWLSQVAALFVPGSLLQTHRCLPSKDFLFPF